MNLNDPCRVPPGGFRDFNPWAMAVREIDTPDRSVPAFRIAVYRNHKDHRPFRVSPHLFSLNECRNGTGEQWAKGIYDDVHYMTF